MTLFHNQNFDRAVKFNLSEELGKGAHVVDISSLFGDTKELGSDLINPQTLLPIFTRIIIYVLGLYMLFSSVYFAISLIKEKERTKMKMTTHLTAVIADVIAVVIMFFCIFAGAFFSITALRYLALCLICLLGCSQQSLYCTSYCASWFLLGDVSQKESASYILSRQFCC